MNKKHTSPAATCQNPDRDAPGLLCGYPLPCPYHTAIIDTTGVVPTVTVPVTSVPAISPKTLAALKDISLAIHEDPACKDNP